VIDYLKDYLGRSMPEIPSEAAHTARDVLAKEEPRYEQNKERLAALLEQARTHAARFDRLSKTLRETPEDLVGLIPTLVTPAAK
jgi:hypothetical protein